MRSIDIAAQRSVKIETLLPDYKKRIPADHKGPDFVFSVGPREVEVPANLEEAVQVLGKDKVFEIFATQHKTNLQNALANELLDKITDPKKTNRRSAVAIQVEL